jgi:ABC-2 type transport system ATP-binding protein
LRGFKTVAEETCVLVSLEDETLYDAVRDTVADLELPLVRIEQERRRLEDLFRDPAPVAGSAQ